MSAVMRAPGSPTGIQQLRSIFSGALIGPGDAEYDAARAVWNGMIDRYPALIARCQSVADVVAAVNFAREHKLVVAVRGGGHNVAGYATCDEGIVIDLSPMKDIQVDPAGRRAHAQGGCTWGDLDAVTQVYGLAAPGGVFSETGIGGLTLGGGYGWLRGKYGLSCDNLIAAEVVTADGRVVHADESENPELLWGLRGGGGNFGVVTTFTYRLHPVGPDVMLAFVIHDGTGEKMKQGLQFYRQFCATVPDEASTIAVCGQVPPEPAYPAELHLHPFLLFGGLYAGDPQEGQRVLQPLRDFGAPLLDFSGVRPYVEAQRAWDADYPVGRRYYWKSANVMSLDDDIIACIAEHAHRQPSPFSTIDVWHIGGAVKRAGPEQSAFNGRQAAFLVSPEAGWEHREEDQANIDWVRACVADMAPFSDGSRYLNFAGFYEEGDEMMQKSFGAQYQRLARLKAEYDPTNLFGLNQNIKPTPGTMATPLVDHGDHHSRRGAVLIECQHKERQNMNLPGLPMPSGHQAVLDRFVAACQADERVVAAFLAGSYARGDADACSDLDLYLIATDEAHAAFIAHKTDFIRRLGEPLFLEDFGRPNAALFILADGTEAELWMGRAGQFHDIHGGEYQVLLDKEGILAGAVFPSHTAERDEQVAALRRLITEFWHDMSHFITALARGQHWWAHGQLEALRSMCVQLARLHHNFADPYAGKEPYFKLEQALPIAQVSALQTTFCPLEADAMLQAALTILHFYQELAPRLAQAHGISYPAALEQVLVVRLDKVRASLRADQSEESALA